MVSRILSRHSHHTRLLVQSPRFRVTAYSGRLDAAADTRDNNENLADGGDVLDRDRPIGAAAAFTPEGLFSQSLQGSVVQPDNPKLLKVAVVGLPNVGKSTLMNRLVGRKVSIVSPKAQTTRERILGISTIDSTQILYFDTPGILSTATGRKFSTSRALMIESRNSIFEADVIMTLLDERGFGAGANVLEMVWSQQNASDEGTEQKHILVINKVDKLRHPRGRVFLTNLYLDIAQEESNYRLPDFSEIFEVSALRGRGVDTLQRYLTEQATTADWLYPSDFCTDQSALKLIEEVIREQLFYALDRELPYHIFQKNLQHKLLEDGSIEITQAIMVKSAAQRSIVIGSKGWKINNIATSAEIRLHEILDRRVKLKLDVRIASSREWQMSNMVHQ